jgi:serine/threonine protein kinase
MTLVGEYRLITEFTTAGGGQSRWGFAERKGRQYFLKEFLSPKYPVDGAPGSASTKAHQRDACAKFEAHHQEIIRALAPLSSSGSNLVVATDFFRDGPRYYKVTEKVEVTDWEPSKVAGLPLQKRLLLMLTVAHSLNVLHSAGMVHGDIKPPNILIKRLEGGNFGTKLIDFDNAVVASKPLPPPDQLVGDMAYYSPELVEYLNEPREETRLSGSSDIFALGLVFGEWMTGTKASYPTESRYPGVAAARGQTVSFEPSGVGGLDELIERMLKQATGERPTAQEVHRILRGVRSSMSTGTVATTSKGPTAPASESGKLRGSLAKKASGTGPAAEPGPAPKPALTESKLRGSLLKKKH